MRYTTITTGLTLGLLALPRVASTQVEPGLDSYLVEDSLEARVWLDRGDEPVVEPGDEVRVYYRTSADAFAAIFRIDTDGRISLVFPQHPDADDFVAGGRDYRLVFRDSSRWRVDEDPGVGYFFMIASPVPLDYSSLGYDAEEGWDLSGVAETVYEDPYVAIDDYVATLLPFWENTPYALDFLEYSVGEDHEYPRFLCYDCHGFQSYASWNPYDRYCSSYSIVVWDDPYFYPRFRYVGTRVVFARPLFPRPRYSFTTRIVGARSGPIVRTRPAPPRRAVFKEAAGSRSPIGRTGAVPRPSVAPRGVSGDVASRARPSVRLRSGRVVTPPTRARAEAQRPRGEAAPPRASQSRRSPPGARSGARASEASGVRSNDRSGRATLQRREPSTAVQRPRGATRPSASRAPSARPSRPSASPPRARPTRPPGGASSVPPRVRPTRPPGGASSAPSRARPTRPPGGTPSASPSRPPASRSGRVERAGPGRTGPRSPARTRPRRPGG